MSSYSKENSAKPPERENSEPAGDGSPERSTAPRKDVDEAKLVADDDAEAFEDQQTGIAISYVLQKREIYNCLKKLEFSSTHGVILVVAFIVLALAATICLAVGILTRSGRYYFFAFCWVLIAAVYFFLPFKTMNARAAAAANGEKVRLEIYPDHIEVGRGAEQYEIPLDGTCECVQVENTMLLTKKEKDEQTRLIVLPLRCVEETALPEVQAMIFAGTRPGRLRR